MFCLYRLREGDEAREEPDTAPATAPVTAVAKINDNKAKAANKNKVKLRLMEHLPISKVREVQVVIYIIKVSFTATYN